MQSILERYLFEYFNNTYEENSHYINTIRWNTFCNNHIKEVPS